MFEQCLGVAFLELALHSNVHIYDYHAHNVQNMPNVEKYLGKCIKFLRKNYDSETPMVSGNLGGWRT